MEAEKQEYVAPRLVVYGNVEEITQEAGVVNADLPHGPNNTAYSPGS